MSNLPIGVFDSGLGGLTVVEQIFSRLPNESILYFGDTARVPYGSKSVHTVQKFSKQIVQFLQEKGVKMIVVACNTASSVALDVLKKSISVPIVGVIEPGVRAALEFTVRRRIGVIGTTATISTGKYPEILKQKAPDIFVESVACPLFVPLVEEGWVDSPVTEQIARIYLKPLIEKNIDTLILGCTHYPLIKKILQKVVDSDVQIIDTAIETAVDVENILRENGLLNNGTRKPRHQFYVSDFPQKFEEIANRFIGQSLQNVKRVSLDDPL
ncbi:MAG: glutamate racemase [Candidatus Marinimicrobia bacterium CG08_land_8_20_14_0_20_45_22]|nr:MAG: glutamate racemase [Candidatus Marinimicrobia bacterium CG08_land_8_20_14_0_20_45_22]